MPLAAETWNTFGDAHSKSILTAATNHDEYENATTQVHARLFLIVCGLSVDELHNMFTAALPLYLVSAINLERLKASKVFEDSQALIEDRVVKRIRAYSQMWLKSHGGIEYETRYGKAK